MGLATKSYGNKRYRNWERLSEGSLCVKESCYSDADIPTDVPRFSQLVKMELAALSHPGFQRSSPVPRPMGVFNAISSVQQRLPIKGMSTYGFNTQY